MPGWSLVYDRFEPERQGVREALCTLGNGCFATRGAHEESEADDVHYPGTYVSGGYNRLRTQVAGRLVENEDLVNMPNWLPLSFRPAGGEWLNLLASEILSYRLELDMRSGLLRRDLRLCDRYGRRTTLSSRRFVHMGRPHLAGLQWVLRPENWSGPIEIRSALDGRVVNAGVKRYRQLDGKHLSPVQAGRIGDDAITLVAETNQSHLRIGEAARTRIFGDGRAELPVERQLVEEEAYVGEHMLLELSERQPVCIEKIVALHTSRDRAISEPATAVEEAIKAAPDFDALHEEHALAWAQLWCRCDLIVGGPERRQMVLRLHVFHLLQTVSLHSVDLDVGVPARGLHGEAYRGHIFWDELFIFPFLNLRLPEVTRALLRYRSRRLPAARQLAHASGFTGAMYPWQSGSSGREETQVLHLNPKSGRWLPDNTHLQHHVNAAIAYNVWRYYEATGDQEFLGSYGAEMLLEIARFWTSAARLAPASGRYVICGVMGPDEFHDRYPWSEKPGIDNNAYTNVMAAWVLMRALDTLDRVEPDRVHELRDQLHIADSEVASWDRISRCLLVPFHDGIISQFEHYDRLEELDWQAYRRKYGDIHRLDRILEAEGDTVNRYKASKQADVLMLFYLFSSEEIGELLHRLGYAFDPASIPRVIDYYLQRTSHGSTLSRVVHSWVLARSDRTRSWALLDEALESDISDTQGGTTAEGIHLGAMAGTVDLVQRSTTGLEYRDEILRLNPTLPDELQRMALRLRFRGHWLDVDLTPGDTSLAAPDGWSGPDHLVIRDSSFPFGAGKRLSLPNRREQGAWRPRVPADGR